MDVTFNQELAALVESLHGAREIDVEETAAAIVSFAVETLEVDEAGITLIRPGRRRQTFETIVPTGETVLRADELQYEFDEGPCVEAAVKDRTVLSEDLSRENRWPRWAPAACELGFRSILTAQLYARDQRLGALNLYASTARHYSWEDAHTAHLFALHASAALAAARSDMDLRDALRSRTAIAQAQGILMERFGVTDAQAFAIMRRYSQARNVKLRDVAAEIVAGASMADLDDAPP